MSQRRRDRISDLPHLACQVRSRATEASTTDDAGRPIRGWWVQTWLHDDRLMSAVGGQRPDDLLFEQGVLVRAGEDMWAHHRSLVAALETAGCRCRQPSLIPDESTTSP